jgi:hypothetical protein
VRLDDDNKKCQLDTSLFYAAALAFFSQEIEIQLDEQSKLESCVEFSNLDQNITKSVFCFRV